MYKYLVRMNKGRGGDCRCNSQAWKTSWANTSWVMQKLVNSQVQMSLSKRWTKISKPVWVNCCIDEQTFTGFGLVLLWIILKAERSIVICSWLPLIRGIPNRNVAFYGVERAPEMFLRQRRTLQYRHKFRNVLKRLEITGHYDLSKIL